MAGLGFTLNASDHIDAPNFEPMPAGDYELQIVEADVKPNSKSTGSLLEYKAEVVNPAEFAGKSIFERLNITHTNPTAQAIGQKALQDLIKAAGLHGIDDTDALLYQPFWAHVEIEDYTARNGEARRRNVVKKYHFDDGQAPPESKPAPTPAPTPRPAPIPAAGGAGKLPWQKNKAAA